MDRQTKRSATLVFAALLTPALLGGCYATHQLGMRQVTTLVNQGSQGWPVWLETSSGGVVVPYDEPYQKSLITRVSNDLENLRFALAQPIKSKESALGHCEAVFIMALRNYVTILNEKGGLIE